MLALLLAACLPHPAPIPVGAVPEDAAVVAIVGPTGGSEPVAPILAEADLVVLLEPVPLRRTLRQWAPATVAGVPVLPVVGGRVGKGLGRFSRAFPGATPFGAAEVHGARIVWLDSSRHPTRRAEQLFWLPRPLGDDVPKFAFVNPGPDAATLIPALHDYEPAGQPTLAIFLAADDTFGGFPSDGYGTAQLWVGPLAKEWWRLDLRGEPTLMGVGPDGPTSLLWHWTPRDGWQADRTEP